MFNSKFNTLLTVLLIIAIIGIIGLIGYFGYSVLNKYNIDSNAKDAVDAFEGAVGNKNPNPNTNTVTPPVTDNNTVEGDITIGEVPEASTNNSQTSQSPTTYYGYNVIGTISIPKLSIKYPILDKATPKALKVAVAYIDGVGVNDVGNTVIQGHNYKNGLFFSNLNKLSNGDKIYILDANGKQIEYEVYQVFKAEATDTSFYRRDTTGKSEITLSTCTTDYDIRTVVFAKEV